MSHGHAGCRSRSQSPGPMETGVGRGMTRSDVPSFDVGMVFDTTLWSRKGGRRFRYIPRTGNKEYDLLPVGDVELVGHSPSDSSSHGPLCPALSDTK